jgi:hypothetical protein
MAYFVVAALILSLVVRYWPGQPAPPAINLWVDRLWVLFGVVFALGIVLAFFNTSTTQLPGGGVRYSWSTPAFIRYALAAIYIPIGLLAVLGAVQIARSEARAYATAPQGSGRSTAGIRLRKLAASAVAALIAIAISLAFGGPLVFSTEQGYSSVVPFIVDMVAAVVFFAALGWAWGVAKTPSEQH